MANLNKFKWGIDYWEGQTPADIAAPQIIFRNPRNLARNAAANKAITLHIFDRDADMLPATLEVEIDGVPVFTGPAGFAPGYSGTVSVFETVIVFQIVRHVGWAYGSTVAVTARITDALANVAQDTWRFSVKTNSAYYDGRNPTVIETAIQSPMSTFLDMETPRQLLLRWALQEDTEYRGNKAARAVHQLAYLTELSTLLNPYVQRDDRVLASVVKEKRNTYEVDQALVSQKSRVQAGIQALATTKAFTPEYVSTFVDYLDSTLYTFRVSLVANLVLATRAIEIGL